MKEGRLERERKSQKYERIFIISFLTTIVLIIGSIVLVEHTGFKYVMYLALAIIVSIGITNDMQKRYKKYSNLSNKE
ncbi:hypothetical protein [Bacillus pseudomycoides]|uniref:hypothetical protein n=1 Tax=Bacillus pseudomycoides TaxID=64104 RepID=UPI000BF6A959|nr:hypothetical protein [Bacillus pseudomycoides]PGC53825.1 hypothetical protein COM14_02480 [Bacillus pseudomycoides]PGD28040.1 hypothetical protein COM30_20795 [Bacillus pseudomycoides]